MSDNTALIYEVFRQNSLENLLDDKKVSLFENLMAQMADVGSKMNLTSIREPEEVVLKHFADCATILPYIPNSSSVLDVGSGGGFPTFPLAILRPDLHIFAIDSTLKKTEYIKSTASLLGLSNVTAIYGRAEEQAQTPQYRAKFDVVTARAVADLPILCELCVPYIRKGGKFIAMKGASGTQELSASNFAYKTLGCSTPVDVSLLLSYRSETFERHIIIAEKSSATPAQYPRAYARITKKPLK